MMKNNIKIALKYCGSCNPQIDISAMADAVKQFIGANPELEEVSLESPGIDLIVLLCGCSQECAYTDDFKALAIPHILVDYKKQSDGWYNTGELLDRLIQKIHQIQSSKCL